MLVDATVVAEKRPLKRRRRRKTACQRAMAATKHALHRNE
jgi:hypothetical protein